MTDATDALSEAALQEDRQSSDFFSTDGEIIVFRSSDDVLFNIHRRNLQSVTSGPFAEDFEAPACDVVELTEDEETLKILFTFVYPGRYPLLYDLPFETFAQVAEAAEKYKVAPAMGMCQLNIRLSMLYKQHPFEIMQFADRHEYNDLLDLAAPHTLKLRVSDARRKLSLPVFAAWAEYSSTWKEASRLESYDKCFARHSNGYVCSSWKTSVYTVAERMHERGICSPEDVDYAFRFEGLPNCAVPSTGWDSDDAYMPNYCRSQLKKLADAMKEKIAAMAPLSSFLAHPS
ncbi:hypothetical protein BD626DRAFT_465226 [Schizophyllum amplum]|uniref:BTB domain-containing protein n=1 Tax=Schizophyllum amplum TaxID=97359 RepID=A0A550BXQ8_9AGAR|nr:hypothetical protein BD626DRAFT_465226 [Auriculariopsis ampla]